MLSAELKKKIDERAREEGEAVEAQASSAAQSSAVVTNSGGKGGGASYGSGGLSDVGKAGTVQVLTIDEQIAQYEEIVRNITSFIEFSGMFELKNGQQFQLFESVNKDAITWKYYNLSNSLNKNQHDIMELNLNISDAALLGSGSSINKSNEIISTFKVSLNNPRLYKEAYNGCRRDK